MALPEPAAAAPLRPRTGLARILFLVVFMTVWADVNDRLGSHFHLGRLSLNALRTLVDCGGVVWLGCMVWGRSTLRDLGWRFERPARLVLVGLAATALVIGTIFAVVALFAGAAAARELGADVAHTPLAERAYFTVVGAKVAFWEETLFRGDLLRALRQRLGALAALLASSVVFALYHLHLDDLAQGPRALLSLGMLMKLVMGCAFAACALRTRSLLPGAIAHGLVWAIMCDN